MRMDFRIKTELPAEGPRLRPESRVMLMGSCFAEHVGLRMAGAGLRAEVNPFGVLYNPESLRMALTTLLDGLPSEGVFFEGRDGLWHSWLHSGAFSAPSREACRRAVTERLDAAARALGTADVLFVTFGTADVYTLADGRTVANCHKQPQQRFTSATLPFDALLDEGNALLNELAEQFPALQIIFTVSPYRYRKYGLHESQLSKARLLHAIDLWCAEHSNAGYFPAYEIVVDELRDYRFYAPDMLHPSDQAVDYVWERFREWAFTPLLCQYADEQGALLRDFAHRPLHPESDSARRFARQCEERKAAFLHKWQQEPPV